MSKQQTLYVVSGASVSAYRVHAYPASPVERVPDLWRFPDMGGTVLRLGQECFTDEHAAWVAQVAILERQIVWLTEQLATAKERARQASDTQTT